MRALEAYLEGRSAGPLFCNVPERTPRLTSGDPVGATGDDVDVAVQAEGADANAPG